MGSKKLGGCVVWGLEKMLDEERDHNHESCSNKACECVRRSRREETRFTRKPVQYYLNMIGEIIEYHEGYN